MRSKMLRYFSLIALGILLIFGQPISASSNSYPNSSDSTPVAPGVVLVGLKPGISLSSSGMSIQSTDPALNTVFADVGVREGESVFAIGKPSGTGLSIQRQSESPLNRIYRLRLTPGSDVLQATEVLSRNPAVAFAEPDYLAHVIATPNDPQYSDQWGLVQINASAAWEQSTGSSDVVIAVIDAGLDTSHPDLASQLWENPGEIAGNGQDDDNNGCVDDLHGWNIVDDSANLSDSTGHGTQVAGVIAAETNNGEGIAGVCWNCHLMVVKVTQSGGVANYSDIAAGVAYAAQKGAEVINLSLGGYADSVTLRTAIEEAAETAVVIGGAGNDNKTDPFYPAAYDEVLAVAGTTDSDAKVTTSNYGIWVDVSAPGEAIKTTFDGGGYGDASGTSMAVPFVSGLAGLLKSKHTDWSPELVQAHIVNTADDIDDVNPGYEGQLGSGRIDASGSMTKAAEPWLTYQSYTVDGEFNGHPEPGSIVDLNIDLFNEWAEAIDVEGTLRTSDPNITVVDADASFDNIGTYKSAKNVGPYSFEVSSSAPYAHDIVFTLDVTASNGYVVSIPLTITIAPGIEYVHGTLNTQTWTNDRTYIIDNDAGVAVGEVLTIEPGTVVYFDGDHSLSVAGTLIADGTEENPIRFTSYRDQPAVGDWGTIKFFNSSTNADFDDAGNYISGSILRHVIIEHGEGINLDNAAPYIADNMFDEIDGAGISGNGEEGLVIADNQFMGTGINLDIWDGRFSVLRNTVSGASIYAFGPGSISGNSVNDAQDLGISTQGPLTVTANRVLNCAEGMFVDGGFVSENLLANNDSNGLRINGGTPSVVSNTIVFNKSAGIQIQNGDPLISHNNLLASSEGYALRNSMAIGVNTDNNWWGTDKDADIQAAIYDGNDEFGLGIVNYSGYLSNPEQTAPAYVTDVQLSPASPVGLEQVAFDVKFSRPMNLSIPPTITFHLSKRGTSTIFDVDDGLADNHVYDIEPDQEGNLWFGTKGGATRYDGQKWITYNTSNSALVNDAIYDVFAANDGTIWFGHSNGISRWNKGKWITYTQQNISENWSQTITDIDGATDGTIWFAVDQDGLLKYDGDSWDLLTTSDGLPGSIVRELTVDQQDRLWIIFGDTETLGEVVAMYDGVAWTTYDTSDGFEADWLREIFADSKGRVWVATASASTSVYVYKYENDIWSSYGSDNTAGYLNNDPSAITESDDGVIWFGSNRLIKYDAGTWSRQTINETDYQIRTMAFDFDGNLWTNSSFGGGIEEKGTLAVWLGDNYPVSKNVHWIDHSHYQATYDITSLVPRGDYDVAVSGARSASTMISGTKTITLPAGDMLIPIETRFGFTVDYAGEISDRTAPEAPSVMAGGKEGDPTTIEAMWWAEDPDSEITGYRYAIGSAAGATDIVNWTSTANSSLTRSGLGLVEGQQYWLSVQASNAGGLWSPTGYSAFVAGQPFGRVFLPLVLRQP
jgi:subtilisin family serine protease